MKTNSIEVKKILFVFLSILLITPSIRASNDPNENKDRPKIGLVLSGGGAKGFAHIGVIKLLEEVGIRPDYITGTSMGSIVGGLYAMGYSPEEMTEISNSTNWSEVLSNSMDRSKVTYVEKAYYSSFLVELDVNKNGVSLPAGLLEGQNLMEMLSALSLPVHGINNFLEFPIPFTCIATNIETGESVALSQGSIVDALRSSMAIPSVFTPVEYEGMLLIDGGWTRNLPVEDNLKMGADIIIAVDVSAPMSTRENLRSLISILDQTAWILSDRDTKEQLKKCDYVVSPPVLNFSTFDFDKSDEIITAGYEEALKQKSVFEALAKKIYPKGRFQETIKESRTNSLYRIDDVMIVGNELTSERFILGHLDIGIGQSYSPEEIKSRIDELHGSLYYKKIRYELLPGADSGFVFKVTLLEDNPLKLKFSIYYDSENSIGANANLTARNIFLKNSRFIFNSFISENPIVELNYLKYIGKKQRSFLFSQGRFTDDSKFRANNAYGDEATFSYTEYIGHIGLGYTTKINGLFTLSIGALGAKASPTFNSDSLIQNYRQTSVPITVAYLINTYDKSVFPSKGYDIVVEGRYYSEVEQRIKLKSGYSSDFEKLVNELIDIDPYIVYKLGYQHYYPVTKKLSLITDLRMTMMSSQNIGFNDYMKVGGIEPILSSTIPYWGLSRNEVSPIQAATASLGFQWNMFGNFFLRAKANYLNTEYPMAFLTDDIENADFSVEGKVTNELYGFGGEIAYNSVIGPFRVLLHQNLYSSDLNVFVAFGFNIFKTSGSLH